MKVCLVTGGTGGHIYPALALADTFVQKVPSCEILFIGNDDRMEATLIPDHGYTFQALHTSGLVGNVFQKARAVIQMFSARQKAKTYLKAFAPDIVIGFGGYVSAPVMMASTSLGIPTIIHEQNSIVGKSNQLVMNRVDAIVTCYQKCEEVFPKEKIHLLGNPRATIATQTKLDMDYYRSLGLDPSKKTILIMMGSLGSSSVNALMKDALRDMDPNLQFLYVCGKNNADQMHMFDDQENIHVVAYVDTLKIYPKVDGLICRAGATTIAELTALGIPSILIPSPYVANNHQFYNASQLVERNAAYMLEEKDLNGASLKKAIQEVFLDQDTMLDMRKQALSMGKPQAAYDMIALCTSLMK